MIPILIRRISPYIHADLLLGVFASQDEVQRHRTAYLATRTKTAASEPWHHQPHKPDGLQASDLIVMQVQGSVAGANTYAFVVSSYSEGFGQVVREFISIHIDRTIAERHAARLQETNEDTSPIYYLVQEVVTG